MKPLCKWSGGKRDEIKKFKEFYPENFERYVEPFAGGAATYFDLNFSLFLNFFIFELLSSR
jgi:DNA adenine methylase